MKKYTTSLALIILTSCSILNIQNKTENLNKKNSRKIASALKKYNLNEVTNQMHDSVMEPISNSKTCTKEANKYYQLLFSLETNNINFENFNNEMIDQNLVKLFETRLFLRKKLKKLKIEDSKDQECLTQVRNLFRAIRYFEDYLIGFRDDNIEDLETFQGKAPYLQVGSNFNFKDVDDLKSGDILLSRGDGYISAAIARIGVDDTQFSHLSLVYRNKKDNQLYTIESHIEIGAIVAPIQKHLDQKNVRTIVYRIKNAKLAHKAAKYMYNKVKKQSDTGKNIPYDFKMNYHDPSSLFCSEVIYEGYLNASKGTLRVPKFKTHFELGLKSFLKKLGIKVNKQNIYHFDTFGPGDIEFDPRFDLVAEWRNPKKIEDSRIKDAVLTSIFEWMNKYDYRFYSSFKYSAISNAAWIGRRTPIVKEYLKGRMPTNMSSSLLNFVIVLEDKVGKVLKEIIMKEQNKKKYPLTFQEMYNILEKARQTDLINYKIVHKRRTLSRHYSVLFHHYLRPPNRTIFKKN